MKQVIGDSNKKHKNFKTKILKELYKMKFILRILVGLKNGCSRNDIKQLCYFICLYKAFHNLVILSHPQPKLWRQITTHNTRFLYNDCNVYNKSVFFRSSTSTFTLTRIPERADITLTMKYLRLFYLLLTNVSTSKNIS
jgi:hypothetical protein